MDTNKKDTNNPNPKVVNTQTGETIQETIKGLKDLSEAHQKSLNDFKRMSLKSDILASKVALSIAGLVGSITMFVPHPAVRLTGLVATTLLSGVAIELLPDAEDLD